MRLRGEGGRQSYTPSCSPLLEGPPATRGSNSPLRRRGQTTQYDSGLPATSRRPGWRADLEAQVPAYLRTCLPHTNTSRRLIWFDESGSRPATRRAVAGRLLGGTHVAHRSQCVELRHVGSRRRQSAAAARRQAVDDGSTAIPTWMRSAPPQALRAPCS